ncbi:LysM peptidoglycan-binding domain-containing protein [Hymenobacter sp. BT730]|uniref:LysM peptidoglycan-binding domain-containing protein n=1 Tax=Hymenobacter sp. BT730 TaxID=3063332 RepID=UPI0026DFF4D7|nr:LysM peptidoglycan-binding domain-containing protein [Hymenobacter sp. BT730]
MIRFWLPFAALLLAGFSASATSSWVFPADSIGVEYQNNKLLIKHRVAPGETLYGLARRYKVPVEDILEANPKVKGALLTGQIVLVPRTRVVLAPAATTTASARRSAKPTVAAAGSAKGLPADAKGNRVYRVKPGQTLFSIANKFDVSTSTLIRQNHLPASGTVNSGQTLIIIPAGQTAAPRETVAAVKPAAPASVSAPEPVTALPAHAPATLPTSRPERETPPVVKEVAKEEPKKEEPRKKETDSDETATASTKPEEERGPERANEVIRRVTESGLAAVIPNTTSVKYLALHKTAPVGTIVQVRNIMNNVSVYVRVIGQLPDTGENSNILIRLSPRAVQMLSTPDARFRVETSYMP